MAGRNEVFARRQRITIPEDVAAANDDALEAMFDD